jgi:hypothetical protein
MTEPQESSFPKETSNLGEETENKANTNQQKLEQELNSPPNNQTQKQPEYDETNLDSSTISENSEDSQNTLPNSEKDAYSETGNISSKPSYKETIEPLPNQKKKRGKLGMYNTNDNIYNNLWEVHAFLRRIYEGNQVFPFEIYDNSNYVKAALDLINRLSRDKEVYQQELDKLGKIKRNIEKDKDKLSKRNQLLERELENISREKNQLSRSLNNYNTNRQIEIQNLHNRYNSSFNNYINQIHELDQKVAELKQEIARLQQEKETANQNLAEIQASQSRLLAEVARLNQDVGIHYNATSNRPQHHILIDEYKTLKEQCFHPLAVNLFSFMEQSNSELKKQRKAKVNEIKATISVTVLMGGHEIMKGKTNEVAELPPKLLEEMEDFLSQKLQLNQIISPETKELLKKAVNSAQDKIAYPEAGKWEEEDFKNTSVRIRNSLFQKLELNIPDIDENLRNETIKVTEETLRFLERTALAEPPADFNLYEEDDSFRSDYHEAAKGFDDEGTIIKTIYPVYLVNGEAKVKAIVLTES